MAEATAKESCLAILSPMVAEAYSSRRSTAQYAVIAASLAYCVVVLTIAAFRAREDQSSTSDFDDFWNTARHLVRTGGMTEQFGVHNYPPFFVLFFAPLGMLPLKAASVVFNGISLIAAGCAVRIWEQLRGDGHPETEKRSRLFWHVGLPVLLLLPYATACLVMGQMALLTMAMLVFAWAAVERRRDGIAGLWLALAIATKVYPAVLLLYFLLRRRWRILAACGAGLLVAFVVLPAAVFGPSRAWRLHEAYWRRSVVGQSALRLAVADSNKMSYANQSFALVARRYTHPTPAGVRSADGAPRFINLVDWPTAEAGSSLGAAPVQWLVVAWTVILIGVGVYRCRSVPEAADPARDRRLYAAFVVLSLLLCPIVWSFYYCVCYPGLAMVCGRVARDMRGRRFMTLPAATLAAWVLGVAALASPMARMGGFHLLATLLLFAALIRRASPDGASCPSSPAVG